MTRERAKKLAPIIKEYGEGKKVGIRFNGVWKEIVYPQFDLNTDYELEPEPELIAVVYNNVGDVVTICSQTRAKAVYSKENYVIKTFKEVL